MKLQNVGINNFQNQPNFGQFKVGATAKTLGEVTKKNVNALLKDTKLDKQAKKSIYEAIKDVDTDDKFSPVHFEFEITPTRDNDELRFFAQKGVWGDETRLPLTPAENFKSILIEAYDSARKILSERASK